MDVRVEVCKHCDKCIVLLAGPSFVKFKGDTGILMAAHIRDEHPALVGHPTPFDRYLWGLRN